MTKRVLIHADDLGMCHGANTAFRELTALGFLDGGSIMVPCPWFKEIATMALEDEELDVGIHLTLNSEKEFYKWGPLTKATAASGLVDDDGFLWTTVAELREHSHPEAAEAEMRAQIDTALAFGVDVTHIDAHMFAALSPEYVEAYLRIAVDYRLPLMLTKEGPSIRRHLADTDPGPYEKVVSDALDIGFDVFDMMLETVWERDETAWEINEWLLAQPSDGLTYFALHPNAPGELDHIEPRTAHIRVGEYDTFRDHEFLGWLDSLGYQRVNWRTMRATLRERLEA